MDSLLAHIRKQQKAIVDVIRQMVLLETPSGSPEAIEKFQQFVADQVAGIARSSLHAGGKFGPHLTCEFDLPGKAGRGQILVLGHSDTVWPLGTLSSMPFRQHQGRLWGPGVLDMKAGIAFFLAAVRALRDLEIPVASRILLQLNSDEEVGSLSSRALTEKNARRSKAVLVLEPGTGLEGRLKTARKGVGDYTLTVRGRASHAGVDFAAGASAVLELARQIERIAAFTRLDRGITVNPGVISGGTRANVVAAEARAHIDIRIARLRDAAALDRRFRSLRPFDRRCTLEIAGGLNRPPMERTAGGAKLFQMARSFGRDLGVNVEESFTGGGSDGNFTAALGVPTLDGLGAVGEGAHAAGESILIDRIADRTALLALLIARI